MITDPALGDRADGTRDTIPDPFKPPIEDFPAIASKTGNPPRPAPSALPVSRNGTAGSVTNEDPRAALRKRLDAIGVQNLASQKDPATGKYFVRCEIPHPTQKDVLRVFENADPAEDELSALQAVTDAVEDWLSQQP